MSDTRCMSLLAVIFRYTLSLLLVAVLFGTGYRMTAQTIAAISPNQAAPGDLVTITGTGFGTDQGAIRVTFGTTPATDIKLLSATSITVIVPNVVPGGVVVSVNGVSSSPAQNFTATVPAIPIAVSLPPIQPVNGKLPASMNLTVAEKNCDAKTGIALTQGNVPYSLTIDGGFLTLSSQSPAGRCSIGAVLAIDPNTPAATYPINLVDKDKRVLGSADIVVLGSLAGPIPPGLPPQVDVLWEVMSQDNCSDVFGKRVSQTEYCIQVKIGNNSGYPLQIAGMGFSSQLDNLPNSPLVTIANSSYASTRAVLIKENVTNFRNILYNTLQAAGVLMAGFTPFFHNTAHQGNWTAAAAIVSGPLLQGFGIVAPNPVVAQLNNLDDQSFRDTRIIANNSQIQTVVFIEKRALTIQLTDYGLKLADTVKTVKERAQSSGLTAQPNQDDQ